MFAPKDQKAKFRVGTKVTHDDVGTTVFKIVSKSWDANGSLNYTIEGVDIDSRLMYIREKDLNKIGA